MAVASLVWAEDPLVLGPKVGSTPGMYPVVLSTGADRGRSKCMFCDTGDRPAVVVFRAVPLSVTSSGCVARQSRRWLIQTRCNWVIFQFRPSRSIADNSGTRSPRRARAESKWRRDLNRGTGQLLRISRMAASQRFELRPKTPPVGLEIMRNSLGKRDVMDQGLAKWLALGVTTAEWQNLPDAAKVFLIVLLQTMASSRTL